MISNIAFLDEPVLLRAPRGRFALVHPFAADVDGVRYTVPAGFETDGASVPSVAWQIAGHPYSPSHLRAAILHDWMCRNPSAHRLSSIGVHRLFHDALLSEGVARVRAALMYWAVALFGPRFAAVTVTTVAL